jgi:hypothetical protein
MSYLCNWLDNSRIKTANYGAIQNGGLFFGLFFSSTFRFFRCSASFFGGAVVVNGKRTSLAKVVM